MKRKCRHIMTSGFQCHGYALHGSDLCYFHSRRKPPAGKPADLVEIPLLEDRCAIQVTLTQILRAVVNKTIDRPRASLLLYGLQLSLQSVDHYPNSIPWGTVQAVSKSSDGEDLAPDPDEEDEDEDEVDDEEDEEVDEDDDEEESGDSGGDSDNDKEDDGNEDSDDDETPEELVAGAKYLESVSNAVRVGDMRQVERLLKE